MNLELIASLLGAVTSLLAGGVASSELIRVLARRLLGLKAQPPKPFAERLSELMTSLTEASRQVDSVLSELAQVARDRESAVASLEGDLSHLEGREKELKERIAALEKTPLPVADHFAAIISSGENRSAKRDYLLFGAGVVVSTAISVIIQVAL